LALAQLHGKRTDEPEATAPGPVEAFVPPNAWKDLAGAGHAPVDVAFVLTGAFEPPSEGRGLLSLLAFDAKDGSTRARVEAHVDGVLAGKTICAAFEELWKKMGAGEIGLVRDIEDLPWEALESVLLAERCALHDPLRGGPHDRLAAMMHLGRAVEDAPEARFPAGRLAALALDTALATGDAKLTDAARRALLRAIEDAPTRVELLEATAALELRAGDATSAEQRLVRAKATYPDRPRIYALLSESRRATKRLDGALDAVHAGLEIAPADPLLLTERGAVLFDRGDPIGAEADWRRALQLAPLFPTAYASVASLVLQRKDATAAEELVDGALLATGAHPEVLRKALHLALALEPDGVARAARLARLCRALLERTPADAWGLFILARAEVQLGEREAAAEHLRHVERLAPGSTIAAEAQRGRFALEEAQVALEIESLLRAVYSAASPDLESLAARGRRIAAAHPVWTAHFALGLVERRRERWEAARAAFEEAIVAAAGATPAHLELVGVAVAVKDSELALRHAVAAGALEGETARTLAVRATALLAGDRREEALAAIQRARELEPADESYRALEERIARGSGTPLGVLGRIRDSLKSWFKP
jgi:tetratricopeptide (TPR) repeat protein